MGTTSLTTQKAQCSSLLRKSSDIIHSTLYYKNNEYYKGDIKDGVRHGYGTHYYKNGDKYEGQWVNDQKHGKGSFFYNETGEMYEGAFYQNKKEGVGIYYWKNGDRYHGEWKENKRHGKGIMYHFSGGKFIGEFKNNLKHGLGEFINRYGDVLYEEWENGQLLKQTNKIGYGQGGNYIDYFNECNANKFDKYLSKKTQKQYENRTNAMKSKYFPLEMAKMLKNKNLDKIDSIRMIQSTTSVIMEKPDVMQWKNEDVVHWFKKIGCVKYINKVESSGIDGKRLLNCDPNTLGNLLGLSDKTEIAAIIKNLELLKNIKFEKYEEKTDNDNTNNEIEENANSEEEEDIKNNPNTHQNHDNKNKKRIIIGSITEVSPPQPQLPQTKEEENEPKENILKELTRESKYFYSSLNVNGLNYFINYEEITKEQIKVGQGGFGEVFLGEWQGKKVAVKKLTLKKISQGDNLTRFINEINISSSLRHPNIVLYMGASVDKDNYYMITEFLSKGSLFDLIHQEKIQLNDQTKIKIAFEIAIAVQYLHSRNIVHCDLKSANVLLDDNLNIKLGDFGLSRFLINNKEKNHGRIGTPHWMAPEILKGGKYQFSADVFSYGMILWELITYQIPYHNIDPNKIVDLITQEKQLVKVPKEGNEVLRQIAEKCIEYEPENRPKMNDILKLLEQVHKKETTEQCTKELYDFLI